MSHYKVTFVPGTQNHCWNKAYEFVREDSSVLDVGCSAGEFGKALKLLKQCHVDGVEPDKGDAKKARLFLDNVYEGFVESVLSTKLKNKKYDHIIFLDVIEHLYDPVDTLNIVKKHLNPNGTIIFSIPNMAHLSVRLMLLKGNFEYGNTGLLDNTHLHYYTKKEVERVFADAGLTVASWDYTEATYPASLIKEQLKGIGLRADDNAMGLLTEPEARIFQFVGAATVTPKTQRIKRVEYSPDPQGQITAYYEGRLGSLQEEYDYIHRELVDLQHKLQDDSYLSSRVPLRTYTKNYLKKKLRI